MSIGKGMLWSLVLLLLAGSANAVSKSVDDIHLSVRIFELGDVERTIVDQAMIFKGEKGHTFFNGGELAGSEGIPPLQFGTRITGHFSDLDGETKSVSLKIELSHLINNDGDNSLRVVRGEIIAFQTKMKLGETTRISMGGNLKCEIRLERHED